jgi:hypothetical protein
VTTQAPSKELFRLGFMERIESVPVVKRTEHFVTYVAKDWNGKERESREKADKFFDTWEAAKQSLIADYEQKIKWKKEEIHRLESRLGQLRKMQP